MTNYPTDKVRLNIGRMLLAVFGFLAVAYYGTMSLGAQDPVWFTSGFKEQPNRIIIYAAGKRTELAPGQPQFSRLAGAIQQCLDQGVSHASGIGYSQGSLDDAYGMFLTVEAFFAAPVKLHANFNTGRPDQMLFPITGRHSDRPLVLLGRNGQYFGNAPILKTIEPLRAVLQEMGYPL